MNASIQIKLSDACFHLFEAVRAKTLLLLSNRGSAEDLDVAERFFDSNKTQLLRMYSEALQPALDEAFSKESQGAPQPTSSVQKEESGADRFSAQEYVPPHELYALSRATNADLPSGFLGQCLRSPFSFQRAGIRYMNAAGRALQTDEQGTGKTLQTITSLMLSQWQGNKVLPLLVICPQAIKFNWGMEIRKTAPDWKTISIMGLHSPITIESEDGDISFAPESEAHRADAVIINYDILDSRSHILREIPFRSIVADESDRLSNMETLRTQAALRIVESVKPEFRYCLTGTPIKKNTMELWPQLCFLGLQHHPELRNFADKFKVQVSGVQSGKQLSMIDRQKLLQMNKTLRSICMVRREKRDVLKLSPKRRIVHWIEIDNRDEYEAAFSSFRSWLGEYFANRLKQVLSHIQGSNNDPSGYSGLVEDMEFVQAVAHRGYTKDRLKQVLLQYVSDKVSTSLRASVITKINKLKQIAAKGKLYAVHQFAKDYLAQRPSNKILIFGWHREIIDSVSSALGFRKIYGQTDQVQKFSYVRDFQTDPKERGLAINIRSGGQGLTLTAAHVSAFVELAWDSAELDQAEDRTHRIGQTASVVEEHYFLADNTIDVPLANFIERKRELAVHGITGDRVVQIDEGRINAGREQSDGENEDFVSGVVEQYGASGSDDGKDFNAQQEIIDSIVRAIQNS